MAAAVIPISDKKSFDHEVGAVSAEGVVCVLFSAEWASSKASFGMAELQQVSASSSQPRCLSVDMGTDEGEELALDLGISNTLPVVRLYQGGGNKEVSYECQGGQCDVKEVSEKVAMLKRKFSATGDADGGVRSAVRSAYAATVAGGTHVLGEAGDPSKRADLLGYNEDDVTKSADLGLGCGNPLIPAKLQPGEIVVDLGSGAGMDCFIAAKEVGSTGHVIGVDMTPEMISKARTTAKNDQVKNVSFRLGEIEHLPVGDAVVNCVISNCVINLSPDKGQVYGEMNRILVPGGRISIADVLRTEDIPEELKTLQSYAC